MSAKDGTRGGEVVGCGMYLGADRSAVEGKVAGATMTPMMDQSKRETGESLCLLSPLQVPFHRALLFRNSSDEKGKSNAIYFHWL